MCKECGCGLGGGDVKIDGHSHEHDHHHGHGHDHGHGHSHAPAPFKLDLNRSLMEKNNLLAERNRGFFRAKKLLVLNVVSSPGSGKTTFIRETAVKLAGKLRVGVIVGDLATDNDAARLKTAGIPVIQITTGTVCHLDADMVSKAAAQLDLDQVDVLVVGSDVCGVVAVVDDSVGALEAGFARLSVAYHPEPLKITPLACSTRRTEPVHRGQVVIGSSEKR